MLGLRRSLGLAVLAGCCTVSAGAAIPTHAAGQKNMTKSVMLHVTKSFMGKAAFKHVMASARLDYMGNDVSINLSANNLPMPSAVGARAYVLFASDGVITDRVGMLHVTGHMAGVKAQVMMSKIADLYVYAVKSPAAKHPQGQEILSAMVG